MKSVKYLQNCQRMRAVVERESCAYLWKQGARGQEGGGQEGGWQKTVDYSVAAWAVGYAQQRRRRRRRRRCGGGGCWLALPICKTLEL